MKNIVFPKISLQNVKGVLIDIDNTLFPYAPANKKAVIACYMKFCRTFKLKLTLNHFYKQYRIKRKEVTKMLYPQHADRAY